MLSPVKAITTAALVFALSAAFLVAQPSDRLGGGVAGAEQAAEPAPPVEVTAETTGITCTSGSPERDGSVQRVYGMTCEVHNEWSDPRLQGTETYVDNSVRYMDDSGLSIAHYVHNIVTDDGAWRMRPQFSFESAGPGDFSGTWVLDGEGAYEGLIAVLAKDEDELHGYIISHELPPAPEDASTK
jgi:hypothetical protein